MSIRSILMIVLALVMAGGTAFYARSLILAERANIQTPQETAEVVPVRIAPDTMVLVSTKNLKVGEFVREDDLEWVGWPDDSLSDAYIQADADDVQAGETLEVSPESFAGAVVRQNLQAGQPVTKPQFVFPADKGFLAAVLEPGFRAISVPVDETSGISGFVFPGDRVDALISMRLKGEDKDGDDQTRYATATVAEDLRVLAIGQTVQNEEGGPIVAKTATLEVTPKIAQKIAMSLQMGSLSLSLRGLTEQNPSLASASDYAAKSFLSGKKRNGRNFTVDVEVFSVNGSDLSLDVSRRHEKSRAAVTVLRGSETAHTSN